jgi:hypothetical protein
VATIVRSGKVRCTVVPPAVTDDYREAVDSYLGKRTPRYSNR